MVNQPASFFVSNQKPYNLENADPPFILDAEIQRSVTDFSEIKKLLRGGDSENFTSHELSIIKRGFFKKL